jgi:hypothetical protein
MVKKYYGMVTKLILKRNLDIFRPDEEDKQNDLNRNRITAKIILRQSDEVWLKNSKLPPK